MLIRNRLRVVAILPAVFLLVVGAVQWETRQAVTQRHVDTDTAEHLRRSAFDMNVLTQEYLLHANDRIERQFRIQHQAMADLLARLNADAPEEGALLTAIRKGHAQIGTVFNLLVKSPPATRSELAGEVLASYQFLIANIRRFVEFNAEEASNYELESDAFVMLALMVLTATSIIFLVIMTRQLMRGIGELETGMRRAALGNLDNPVMLDTADEFGALARSFNGMSLSLRGTYGALKAEVAERWRIDEERTRALDRLHTSETLLRTALKFLPVGVWMLDAGGRINYVNAAGEQLWAGIRYVGIEQFGEYKGWRPGSLTPLAPHEWSAARAIEKGETTVEEEIEIECFDGTRKTVLISALPLRAEDGAIEGALVINLDITARKKAENEIHALNASLEQRVSDRTAALRQANEELEAFSYSVSHDLRAPLRAIDGFSHKVIAEYGEKLDAEGRRELQVIRDNAKKMGQLIDDLLDFSRMGRREMALQPVNVESTVRAVVAEACRAAPERKIEVTILPLPDASGDVAMLRQVWVNLIGNAIKFTGRRAVAHVEIGGRIEGDERIYWVRDDGDGFDAKYAGKLFGVFQRLHRQDQFPGTGVGLAIAHRVLTRHGGRIWAEGRAGEGATFWFALPADESKNKTT